MGTMSLFESGDSIVEVSLQSLFEDQICIEGGSDKSLEDIALIIVREGYPLSVCCSKKSSSMIVKGYYQNLIDIDCRGSPSFLAVITATKYAYTHSDGIHVILITCLKN